MFNAGGGNKRLNMGIKTRARREQTNQQRKPGRSHDDGMYELGSMMDLTLCTYGPAQMTIIMIMK